MAKYTSEWCIPVIELTPELKDALDRMRVQGFDWQIQYGYITYTGDPDRLHEWVRGRSFYLPVMYYLFSWDYCYAIGSFFQQKRIDAHIAEQRALGRDEGEIARTVAMYKYDFENGWSHYQKGKLHDRSNSRRH